MTIKLTSPEEKEALQKVCTELGYKCLVGKDADIVDAHVNIFDLDIAYAIGKLVENQMTQNIHKEIYGK